MNTRVDTLLAQATKEVWGTNDYNGSPEFEGYDVDQKKFAELIVLECLDACNPDNYGRGDEWEHALLSVMREIKTRFGIEK